MKIDKVSEYKLKDDIGNEVRIKFDDDRWHLTIDDKKVFSFDVEGAKKLASLLTEINRSSHVFLQVLKEWDKADSNSVKDENLKHIIPQGIY